MFTERYWPGAETPGRGEKRDRGNIYRYTVTTRMTPALRWAAMRAILVLPELMILIKRYALTRVKLTALYKHHMTKTT